MGSKKDAADPSIRLVSQMAALAAVLQQSFLCFAT